MLLQKDYRRHYGVDRKSSNLTRPIEYAEDMRNAEYTDTGSINKRPGYQTHAKDAGGFGLFTYQRADPTSGLVTPITVSVDNNLHKLSTASILVTYSGASTSCQLSFFVNSTTMTYVCQIEEGRTTVLNYDLGTGVDTATPVTLANLATQINALAGFTAVVTGDSTTPAAFVKIVRAHDLSSSTGSAFTGVAKSWTQVNSTTTNPFDLYYANRNKSDHENVSATQIQNCIYFGTGFTSVYKYDGQTFYKAGLPTPAAFTVSSATAGAVTGDNYIHVIQYAQYDAAGNIIEGNFNKSAAQTVTAKQFDLTVPNIQAGTGFNTNAAIVNGAQVSVTTITVSAFHTIKVGDTAYFFDSVSASYVTRTVTAIGGTTITISGAAVTVANGAVISNNLRILIFRSKSSAVTPTLFYLVAEIPNNSFAATQAFVDNKVDGSLGFEWIEPATDRSIPPQGRYVSQWNGQMMVAGVPTDPIGLYPSDVEGSEYFDAAVNFPVDSGNGDTITGIAPNNEVFTIHGSTSFSVLTGDITTFQVRIETKSRDSGCSSHASLAELDGVLVWLSPRGPRYSQGGQVPLPLGSTVGEDRSPTSSRIDPEFDNNGKAQALQLIQKRAVGFSDIGKLRYILYVPAESTTSSQVHPNSNSKTFVYDKTRDAWLIWDNLNMASGMAMNGMDFYFQERRYTSFISDVASYLHRRHSLVDEWDYADNVSAVSLDYAPQWEFLGEPSVLKKATKVKVFSIEDKNTGPFTVSVDHEINFQKDVAKTTFSIEMLSGGYGVSQYGIDAYGDPSDGSAFHTLSRDRVFSSRTRFKNTKIHENVIISGWETEYDTPYRADIKP